ELQDLLHAVFADTVDFLVVPNPKRFVIYADHDEYTTFFVNTRSHINRIAESLLAQGFEEIARYTRSYRLPEKPGRFLREHGFYSAVSTGGHEYPLRIPQAVSSRVTTPIPISH